ncbi:hypothetical protein [Actinokineospora enzanensis]|uniref:hypothetical protein n=1 Tax=Actinokineospora enzanensis TaxID=155975 RepID=UPI00037763A2|nr:hypothetical protein [Actinokineospora enzanensis]
MGTNTAVEQAAKIQEEQSLSRVALIRELVAAQEAVTRTDALARTARESAVGLPAQVALAVGPVVLAAEEAAAVARATLTAAWQNAKTGGWSPRQLTSLGLKPVRARRAGGVGAAAEDKATRLEDASGIDAMAEAG